MYKNNLSTNKETPPHKTKKEIKTKIKTKLSNAKTIKQKHFIILSLTHLLPAHNINKNAGGNKVQL